MDGSQPGPTVFLFSDVLTRTLRGSRIYMCMARHYTGWFADYLRFLGSLRPLVPSSLFITITNSFSCVSFREYCHIYTLIYIYLAT